MFMFRALIKIYTGLLTAFAVNSVPGKRKHNNLRFGGRVSVLFLKNYYGDLAGLQIKKGFRIQMVLNSFICV